VVCSQLKLKKRVVGVAILLIWITLPAIQIISAILANGIIKERCILWGAYSSYAMERAVGSLIIFIAFFLPLVWMVVCYSRIVYSLRNKVTSC